MFAFVWCDGEVNFAKALIDECAAMFDSKRHSPDFRNNLSLYFHLQLKCVQVPDF